MRLGIHGISEFLKKIKVHDFEFLRARKKKRGYGFMGF